MKKNILLLILLSFANIAIMARDENKSCKVSCHKPEKKHKKRTCSPTPISHSTTIKRSGSYCLTRNIVGTIVIAADNVMLDLNCHLVDGDGAAAAISVTGRSSTNNFNDITITNGAVTNKGSTGIAVTNCSGAVLTDLQIYGSNQALALTHCSSSQINDVKAYDNLSVSSAVILIESCDSIQLSGVQADGNNKALIVTPTSPTDPGMGIIAISNSTNVTMTASTTNSNTQTNNAYTFVPLAILSSNNVQVDHQSNNNSISADVADTNGLAAIGALYSSNVVLDNIQTNGNNLGSTTQFLYGVYILSTPHTIVSNAQINDNMVQLLAINPGGNTNLAGIAVVFATVENDVVISRCQICRNTVVDAGSDRTPQINGDLFGIYILGFSDDTIVEPTGSESKTTIEYCQIQDNIIQSQDNIQFNFGIIVVAAEDINISHCTLSGNNGGQEANGVTILGFPFAPFLINPCRNINISDCTANNHNARDFARGFLLQGLFADGVRSATENCAVVRCQANNNSAGINGYGICLADVIGGSIVNCQTDMNSHAGIFAGIANPVYDPNPVNTDCSILNCSAKENGTDTIPGNGIELSITGINDNFLLQNNVCLSNTGTGFLHTNATLTSAYFNNYARGNGTNYIIDGGVIQMNTYNVGTGVNMFVPNGATSFPTLTNIDGN